MALIVQHPKIQQSQTQGGKRDEPVAHSSFIQNISYDSQSLQLTVTMKSGGQYQYFYVMPNVAEDFIQARSKGEYYSKIIRGKHQSTRTISKNIGKPVQKKT